MRYFHFIWLSSIAAFHACFFSLSLFLLSLSLPLSLSLSLSLSFSRFPFLTLSSVLSMLSSSHLVFAPSHPIFFHSPLPSFAPSHIPSLLTCFVLKLHLLISPASPFTCRPHGTNFQFPILLRSLNLELTPSTPPSKTLTFPHPPNTLLHTPQSKTPTTTTPQGAAAGPASPPG